jgi:hypothetical protein
MRVARVGVIAAAVLAVATMAWAQKTDFSGTWTLDAEASGMQAGAGGGGGGRGGGGGALGMGGSIKQTADTLTIERMAGENKVTLTYKLDGTESKNSMMGRGGAAVEQTSVAKWDGAKLVITTKQPGQDGAMVESTQTWSLAGAVLTVEGTGGRGPTKRVYKKG